MNFIDFLQAATGNSPYHFQRRLAGGDAGTECRSQLINIPTGLGKTAAVTVAWLWNQLQMPNGEGKMANGKPRGEYAIPGKVDGHSPFSLFHSPVVLMGGEELDDARRDWGFYPEKPAILIGTQDMLLSRALNRCYGMSRYD
jgi:CRISPR-associated endonuclease/helicase Cas3